MLWHRSTLLRNLVTVVTLLSIALGTTAVQAREAVASSTSGRGGMWLLGYGLTLTCLFLGVAAICKPGVRKDLDRDW